jgi:hypothetical protein
LKGVCGSKIDEALEILCGEGGFVERKYRKRSVSRIEPDILGTYFTVTVVFVPFFIK